MSERRTRRQTALAAASNDETPTKATSDITTNGNSVGSNDHAVATDEIMSTIPKENIFIFWPNVIGMQSSLPLCSYVSASRAKLTTVLSTQAISA